MVNNFSYQGTYYPIVISLTPVSSSDMSETITYLSSSFQGQKTGPFSKTLMHREGHEFSPPIAISSFIKV
jgi:hypothetical protein